MSTVRSRTEAPDIPEVGQVVRCRGQVWAVNEVLGSSQPADPLADVGRHHLIRLSSLEDDGFGDELMVIWEIEPGTEIIPRQELPRPEPGRLDPPARLGAFLDAVRWGAVATADTQALQAPFRAGITIEEYQLDPVVRALSMPRVNLLVADDVGLGKTIEAGLVVQELLLRHRAHSVIVVCPASLCIKWKEEMRDRFGLEFRIANTDAVRQLRRDRGVGANIFTSFPRLIVSIDWLKDSRAQSLLDEVLVGSDHRRSPRRFDMLIVDEVHSAAPSGRGRYAVDSLRTKAIKRLAPHCEHRLFLSATPHNGYQVSFTALLEMLDPQRFARGVEPNPRQLARVLVRRLKRELRNELPPRTDGAPVFADRRVIDVPVEYPDDERGAHEQLNRYAELRRSRQRGGSRRSAADFVTLLLKKRLLSSSTAFANTLAEHRATLARATSKAPASETQMRAAWDRADDESGGDDSGDPLAEALRTVSRGQAPLSTDERQLLDELSSWADSRRYSPDARAEALFEWLVRVCRDRSGEWTDERVIVFTEYRDTQKWLHDLLLTHDFGGDGGERIALLYGGMEENDASKPRRNSRRIRPGRRFGFFWLPTRPRKASICSGTAGDCCTGRSHGIRPGSNSETAGSTVTDSRHRSSRSATSCPRGGMSSSRVSQARWGSSRWSPGRSSRSVRISGRWVWFSPIRSVRPCSVSAVASTKRNSTMPAAGWRQACSGSSESFAGSLTGATRNSRRPSTSWVSIPNV